MPEKETVLISACLIGTPCRYDGISKPLPEKTLDALKKAFHLIPVCPEILGGLATPRIPAEIAHTGDVIRRDGVNITDAYRRGAEEALRLAHFFACRLAILKERSPSCGIGTVYDGSFSRTLTEGDGVTAALLKSHGIRVIGESGIAALLD